MNIIVIAFTATLVRCISTNADKFAKLYHKCIAQNTKLVTDAIFSKVLCNLIRFSKFNWHHSSKFNKRVFFDSLTFLGNDWVV